MSANVGIDHRPSRHPARLLLHADIVLAVCGGWAWRNARALAMRATLGLWLRWRLRRLERRAVCRFWWEG